MIDPVEPGLCWGFSYAIILKKIFDTFSKNVIETDINTNKMDNYNDKPSTCVCKETYTNHTYLKRS